MKYIDIAIPLIAGITALLIPDKLIPTRDATYEKKKSLLKNCGYLLIGVSILYFIIKSFN